MYAMLVLLEVTDAAKLLNLASTTVRALADAGRLRVAATTPRGARLFAVEDVEAFRTRRAARARHGLGQQDPGR